MDKLDGICLTGSKICMGGSHSQPAGTEIFGVLGLRNSAEGDMHVFHMVQCDPKR